jgi:hypothetical protein
VRAEAQYNSWARQILWANTLPEACPASGMDAASEACVAWVTEFQQAHGLRVDGLLGPGTLLACISVYGGGRWSGPGPAIIGGREADWGWPVWRMPTLGVVERGPQPTAPDLIALLSIGELDRVAKRRVQPKPEGLRAHFSVDASRGRSGEGMILQWADPAMASPFSPSGQLGDYPSGRVAVGVEVEDPLGPHYREREGKTRLRERDLCSAFIAGMTVRQLGLFPEQVTALGRLLGALTAALDIPMAFPQSADGLFETGCEPARFSTWRGVAARFHWHNRNSEPGAGVVEALPSLFEGVAQTHRPRLVNTTPPPPRPAAAPAPRALTLDRVTDEERARLADAWAAAPTAAAPAPRRLQHARFSLELALRRRALDASAGDRAARDAALRARLRPHLRYPLPDGDHP